MNINETVLDWNKLVQVAKNKSIKVFIVIFMIRPFD